MAKIDDNPPDDPTKPLPRARAAAAQPAVVPTEQIATTPKPVRASAAASGGTTGLTDARTQPTEVGGAKASVFRRHPIATGVTAGILAVIVASGLTAWGVDSAVTASLTNQASPIVPLSTATPAPTSGDQGGKLDPGRAAFRATIQTITKQSTTGQAGDLATWTILTRRGQTVTVQITGTTQFGTKKNGETQSSFAVGDSVLIVATRTDGTVTAVRVAAPEDGGTSASTPSPTSTATT